VAEPLVLLHTLGSDRRMWDPVLGLLSPERDAVALDLPGFGSAPPLPEGSSATPAALAAAVAEQIRSLGLARPHVAGNSLGGWVALELALAGLARSVTAIAPAGLWARPLMEKRGLARAAARAALPLLSALVRSPRGRKLALSAAVAHPERVPAAAAARLVRSYATAPGFEAANRAMRAGRFTGLGRIRVPVTLGWPEHDRLVGRPANLPRSIHSVVLRGCGHLPTWDDPEQVARLLLRGSAHS